MKKLSEKLIALLLATVMLCSVLPFSVFAEGAAIVYTNGKYTAEKISHPTTGEGQPDGLVEETDRQNSYSWSMAQLGDWIYIGCNRNLLYSGLSQAIPSLPQEIQAIIPDFVKTIANDEIPIPASPLETAQGVIVRCNIKTKKMETYFASADYPDPKTTPYYSYCFGFRSAKRFKDAIFMNAMSAAGNVIYKITEDAAPGVPPEVVKVQGGENLRAMALSNNEDTLYIGGTEPNEGEVDFKPVVFRTTDGENFEKIATFNEPVFAKYIAKGAGYYAGAGGDVWDIAEYNGNIFMSFMTYKGSPIFRGHYAPEDVRANDAGWVWTELAGDNIENMEEHHYGIGFDNALNYAMMPYVFNDQVYFLTFTDAMDTLIEGVFGLLEFLNADAETRSINTFFESLKGMEAAMENQASIYRLKENGEIEMTVGSPELLDEGSKIAYVGNQLAGFNNDSDIGTTLYNWRAETYNDKMYVGTLDTYPLFKYLTKLTNGDLLNMSADQFRQQLNYVVDLLKMINKTQEESITAESLINQAREADENNEEDQQMVAAQAFEASPQVEEEVTEVQPEAEVIRDGFLPESTEEVEKPTNQVIDKIIDALVRIQQSLDKEATVDSIHKALENIPEAAEQLTKVQNRLGYLCWRYRYHPVLHKILRTAYDSVAFVAKKLDDIDEEGLNRYIRISETLAKHQNQNTKLSGFELYSTKDGVNFDTVTLNGFNDQYNWGVRNLLATDDGLYVGTANPFYGTQLWKLTDGDEKEPQLEPAPTPVKPEAKKVDTGLQTTDTTMFAVFGLMLTALLITGLFIWRKRKAVK